MSDESKKNRDLEILRAVAITYVIALHWAPHFLARFGSLADMFNQHTALWSGVDLFFCISGFVIAKSTLERLNHSSFAGFSLPFWIRRIFRLWPSAWLWALTALALSIVWNRSGLFGDPWRVAVDVAAAILNLANIHYYRCLELHTCGSLSVYWSLSLEEQFYWIFPFLVFWLRRQWLVPVLFALALAQILIPRSSSFIGPHPSLLWLIRTDAICLGIVLAMTVNPAGKLPIFLKTPVRAAAVTLTCMVILATAAAPALHLSLATGYLAIASAILVWAASYDRGLVLPSRRFDGALLWVGSRSYSLYLTHWVAGKIASELRDRVATSVPMLPAGLTIAFGVLSTIGFTIAFAEGNYRILERPLRDVGRRLADSSAVPGVRALVKGSGNRMSDLAAPSPWRK
jgi:peptidoglycan/LPS O-acetylase OafA/YrhL